MKRTLMILIILVGPLLLAGCGIGNDKWSAPFGSAPAENSFEPTLILKFDEFPPNLTHLSLSVSIGDNVQWAWSVDGGGGGLGNQADPTIVPAAMGLLKPTTQPADWLTEPLPPEPPDSSGIGELEVGS